MKFDTRCFKVMLAAICFASALETLKAEAADSPVIVAPMRVDALQIRTESESYVLSMPISKLSLRIPQTDLIQKAGAESSNPRHFRFERDFPKLALLGSFDNADRYPGVKKLWKYESETAEQSHLPKPQHPKYSRIGGWDVVQFEVSIRGAPTARLSAHFVRSGTWINVELYTAADSKAALPALLKTLSVSEAAD